MKLGIVGYVPPPAIGHPEAFLRNVRKYKCKTDLLLYSDHAWPDTLRLKGSPEVARGAKFPDGQPNKFGVPNACFFTGLRIAKLHGYTHVIVLEEDCRVGCDFWDEIMWEEYFGFGRPLIAAGSLAVYNPCNHSASATRSWQALIRRNTKRNFPIVTYGFSGAGVQSRCCVFPNGALAVYDLRWLGKFFDLTKTVEIARLETAWDMAIGYRLWDAFQDLSYEVVGMMESVWSGYGDIVTDLATRQKLLVSGEVVAIHQVKTDWTP